MSMSNDEYTKVQQKCLSDMAKESSRNLTESHGGMTVIQTSRAQQMACKVFRSFDSVIEDVALLNLEILLKNKRIKELEAKLHGTRQHVTEVTMK